MRNPNGFGSVIKLSGNRRRPYMARITVGWKDNGQPIYKALDYFAKREDALICLANYNDSPYMVDYRNITFEELFQKLKEIKYPSLGGNTKEGLNAAFKYCAPLYKQRYRTIKAYQMQRCIDQCPKSYSTKASIKTLFWHMDRLAFELEVITKRFSEVLTVPAASPKRKTIFTDAEVRALWQKQGDPNVGAVLFMLYTGMRISEMLSVRCEDVDLAAGILRGGTKTEAGKNRVIPIHPKLLPIVEAHMGGEVLFQLPGFREHFKEICPGHTSHECRHTFRSKLDSAGANKTAIDMIMGHKSASIGERVYTHKTIEELKAAINLLVY